MSYDRAGFDPTTYRGNEFDIASNTIYGIGVHVVDLSQLLHHAEDTVVTLVDFDMPPNSDAGHVNALVKDIDNYWDQPARLYHGEIELKSGKYLPDNFARLMDTSNLAPLHIDSAPYKNVRFVSNSDRTCDTDLSYNREKIFATNQGTHHDHIKRHERRLVAPSLTDVEPNDQFWSYMHGLLAAVHVAHNINHKETRNLELGDLVLTPDGPLYRIDSGYVHRAQREYVNLTRPKQEIQTQTEVKPGLDSLYGIEAIKAKLQPLILHFKHQEVAARWKSKRPNGVFLSGPPGTGKSTIIHALGADIGADVQEVKGNELYGQYMGDSQNMITSVFDSVRNASRLTILFFDEFEGLIKTTDGQNTGTGTVNAVAGIFKKEAEQIAIENPNIILAGATNYPDRVDASLIRAGRFDLKITVPLPNETARQQLFGNLILGEIGNSDIKPEDVSGAAEEEGFKIYENDLADIDNLAEIARLTDGFSIADIVTVLAATSGDKFVQEATGHEVGPISLMDLKAKIMEYRQSQPNGL
jgi:DNA polymerase III delta prime subunit